MDHRDEATPVTETARTRTELAQTRKKRPARDLVQYFKEYAEERPDTVALWCFGIGFILGWKLKPW